MELATASRRQAVEMANTTSNQSILFAPSLEVFKPDRVETCVRIK